MEENQLRFKKEKEDLFQFTLNINLLTCIFNVFYLVFASTALQFQQIDFISSKNNSILLCLLPA